MCVCPDLAFVFAAASFLPALPGRVRRLPRARPFFTLVTCIFDIAVSQGGREGEEGKALSAALINYVYAVRLTAWLSAPSRDQSHPRCM